MIEIRNAIIGYNEPLFRVDSMQLEKGNVYALIGRNGVGKSTFLNTLLGYKYLLSGTISINEKELKQMSLKSISDEISFVGSKFDGVEFLTVFDFVALGKFPNSNWIGQISKEEKNEIREVIEEFQLSHLKDKFTTEISDGERQLSAVARAFVQGTDIIVLDEPSAFLDYINRKRIIDLLLNLSNQKNKCILISTHDLDLAFEAGLNFLAIHDGVLEKIKASKKSELVPYFNSKK